MAEREELRAADVDREFVAERLKGALDEGRLSLHEYDERLRDTYSARTYADLDKLLADLPGPGHAQLVPAPPTAPVTPAAPAAAPVPADRSVPRWLAVVWGSWLTVVLVNIMIWGMIVLSTGHLIYFWPMWVAGPWGAVLLAITVSGLVSGEPHRHASKYADKYADKMARRQERWDRRRERRQRKYG